MGKPFNKLDFIAKTLRINLEVNYITTVKNKAMLEEEADDVIRDTLLCVYSLGVRDMEKAIINAYP